MNTLVVRPARIRTAGVRQQILLTAQQRLMILMLLFMAAFCLVSVRLLAFALFDTSAGHRSGAPPFVPAPADIVDRHGQIERRSLWEQVWHYESIPVVAVY